MISTDGISSIKYLATLMKISKTCFFPWLKMLLKQSHLWERTFLLPYFPGKHPPLSHYFKQLFAQVTNPPIDSLREEIVTDTTVYIGSDGNLLEESSENCTVLEVQNPILTGVDLMKIKSLDRPGFKSAVISLYTLKTHRWIGLWISLFVSCDRAYTKGANILILSDRGVDENHVAIPSLLAVSAMEQHLVRTKKRTAVSIILESAEPRDVHQFAAILGYGARAVHPILAHECISEMIDKGVLDKDYHTAIHDYNEAVLHGIVKIAAKMGISTLQSYQSAQIFEAVGISREVIDKYFTNTVSRVGGIGMKDINDDVIARHNKAFDPLDLGVDTTLDSTGFHRLRSGGDKEDHLYNPATIIALQQATQNGDYERFKEYTAMVDDETRPTPCGGSSPSSSRRTGASPSTRWSLPLKSSSTLRQGAMSYGSSLLRRPTSVWLSL